MYREKIDAMIADCMKAGKKVDVMVWRAIKNELLLFKTGENTAGQDVTDEVEFKIIKKLADQRRDSIASYEAAGRSELASAEKDELAVLEGLLPKEPSEDEIKDVIKSIVSELIQMNGTVSMRDMKTVQSMVRQTYPTANGGKVAELFRKFI